METDRYADFSLKLHRRAEAQRVPVNGTFEVTRRCPLRCVHCYNNLSVGDPDAQSGELSYEEHCRVLDEITEMGCLWLLYTGGEIFARNDFLKIYTYAKKKGLLITLFTNGTLITPKIADYLVQWPPFSIEITLYGSTKKTHERITGVRGSYERCLRGIGLLTERKLPLKLKSVVVTSNKNEIWEIKRFAEDHLGLEFRFDAMINPRVDYSKSPLSVRLKPEEVVELDVEDPKRLGEWEKIALRSIGSVSSPEQYDHLYSCGGGKNAFSINPTGRLSICGLYSRETWDLRQGSFREGWENFLFRMRHRKVTRKTKCATCEIKAMCGMCPVMGELENRDEEEPVDFFCQVAHLRARALGLGVKSHGACEYCKSIQESVSQPRVLKANAETINE